MKKQIRLMPSQLGLYSDCMNDDTSTLYNLPFLGRLGKGVDTERFAESIRSVLLAHPVLGARLGLNDAGEPVFVIDDDDCAELVIKELGTEEFEALRGKLVRRFDLGSDRLSRFEIYKTPDGDYCFYDIHHLIFDGSAGQILAREISEAYNGKTIMPEEYDIAAVSEDTYAARESDAFLEAKEYFEALLGGCEPDCLPARDVYSDTPRQGYFSKDFSIDADAFSRLRKELGISTTSFFTTVFGFLIARYNYSNESVISTIFSNRNEQNKNTYCYLVKMLPFVTQLDGRDSIKEFLKEQCDQLMSSREKCIYDFSDAAKDHGVTSAINFAYQGYLHDYEIAAGLDIETERIYDEAHIERTELIFELCDKGQGSYQVEISYRADSYSEGLISLMADAYVKLVNDFLTKSSLSETELADSRAYEVTESFNRTEYDYGELKTVVRLFREKAKENPDNTAVVSGGTSLTYGELDRITDNLALQLRKNGVDRESVVGILIDRSEYMAICALGALKACGAYLPLDPTYPPERLNLMMKDSGARVLISTPELSPVIDESFDGLRLMTESIKTLPECDEALPEPQPEDLLIMLYTSGSTGVPKGVMLEQGNLAMFCAWARRFYKMDKNARVAAYASFGFDACMLDMYPTLTAGGTLYIIPEEMRLDILGIQEYFNANGITHAFMTTQLGRQFAMLDGTKTLKELSVGGEKLVPLDVPPYELYNCYGPTECTIFITIFRVAEKMKDIPIGRATDNVRLYVVDKNGKLLPPGAAGELWIAGPQVARGYLNRPEKTAEAFTENPFSSDERYGRVYHTGDVVRYLCDGNIQFIGRRDAQVKIRGFRIELTEVEEVIRRYPGIKDATVAAYDNPAGGKFIAAYICSDEQVDIEAMNSFIREEKPPYMVPAVTMQIDAIPYNQNLKVNKRALPKPELISAPESGGASDRPMTKLEERLAELAEAAAGIKITDVSSPLINIGLTSLSAISFVTRMEKEIGLSLPVKKILSGCSLIDIENALVEELFTRDAPAEPEDTAAEPAGKYPLTETQFGIYSECMMNPGGTMYNIPCSYRIDKATGAERLCDAIVKVIDAHSAVKCTIEPDENGDIFMIPHEDAPVRIKHKSGSEADAEEYWQSFARPFDMAKELYRITVYETDEYLYMMTDFHHIMFDGTSLGVFIADLNSVLAGNEIEKESRTIFDFALREKKAMRSEEFTEAKSYYDTLMQGSTGCAVPDPDRSEPKERAGLLKISRPELRAGKVNAFCERNGITPNAFFLAVAGLVLGKYAYSDDVSFTTIYNGRSDTDAMSIFGMFVKTLPLRCFPEPEKNTVEFIRDMGKQILANMSNDLYSFAKISRAYNLSADYMIVYQGEGFGGDVIDGRPAVLRTGGQDSAKSDISTDVWVEGGAYRFETEYRADKYSEEYIERYTDVLAAAAKSMLTAATLGEVDIASDKQKELIESFNDTDMSVELMSIDKLFEAQVKAHPDMTAVIANGESLTYRELNSLANRLANNLIGMGIAREAVVGIVLDRTKEVYISEYGVLKAGGAFLPMTSEYPDERIDFCLIDAECPFVITTEKIKAERPELFAADKPYRTLTVEELISCGSEHDPRLDIPLSSLAYCIYTSGSTGKPKGVMIEHGNLSNFVNANEKNDETKDLVYPGEVMLGIAAISFDVSIMESFIPLCNGMTACMANDDEIHNPIMLCELLERNNVTVMCATPSFIMNIVDIPQVKKALANMKAFDLGAEAFPGALYDKLHAICPDACIINGYGPTETTISCISKIITSSSNITIGKPAANVKAYVMDKACHIMPVGVSGELVICGKGVGRGYMNLPEKTEAVFFEYNGQRAYRSGDLVRYNAEGEIEFFGRLDNQVKLRGLRVELDEIENVMNEFDGVLVSKVIVRNNGSEDYLAGFFTAEKPVDVAALTEYMKSKLAAYMVPAAILALDEMPLTVNGKIDKKRLPATEVTAAAREYTAPETPVETEFCNKFAEILNLDRVGALDNFFEIGGTSLSATKVVMFALTKGYNIVYKDVFDNPTPRELAAFIEGGTRVNAGKEQPTEYDYADVNTALSKNIMENADNIRPRELGNIILTGATGFLGVHILRSFLEDYDGKVYCLMRRGTYDTCERRLMNMLMYYFDNPFAKQFGTRVFCIEGDITDKETLSAIKDTDAATVINCAACVKHFTNDDILDRVNVGGVKNLIDVCAESGKRLVQISTTSVAGEGGIEDAERLIHENELYFGQRLDNDYVRTKFLAERAVLEARARRGLDGMVIRVGNLMSRLSDGEFQINYITNGFMRSLKAYKNLGMFPITALEAPAEFSPIDSTAGAILALTASESEFCVFHAYNDHIINMADVIYAMKDYGFDIEIVSEERFSEALSEAAKDESMADAVLGLVAYDSGSEDAVIALGSDNRFTKNVLYRLRYKWPITDNKYLANAIEALDTLSFFE